HAHGQPQHPLLNRLERLEGVEVSGRHGDRGYGFRRRICSVILEPVIQVEAADVEPAAVLLIQRICDETEPRLRLKLPTLAKQIKLQVFPSTSVIPQTGEMGSSLREGVITWSFDPNHPDGVMALAEQRLRSTLFHELHHQVRGWIIDGGPPPSTFMHGVVCEGLATACERDETGVAPPWGSYP